MLNVEKRRNGKQFEKLNDDRADEKPSKHGSFSITGQFVGSHRMRIWRVLMATEPATRWRRRYSGELDDVGSIGAGVRRAVYAARLCRQRRLEGAEEERGEQMRIN